MCVCEERWMDDSSSDFIFPFIHYKIILQPFAYMNSMLR